MAAPVRKIHIPNPLSLAAPKCHEGGSAVKKFLLIRVKTFPLPSLRFLLSDFSESPRFAEHSWRVVTVCQLHSTAASG
jgi:hypothetical protein